jgi:membrane associated rhomboid family serine protease
MRPGEAGHSWQRSLGSVVKPLIWANVIVFLVTELGRLAFPGGLDVTNLLTLHPYYLRKGEVWRLGTYMFVHGGVAHLFFNMWGLYLFGRLVEDRLGPQRFLRLYLISGVIGGLVWLVANWWGIIAVTLDPRISDASILALQRLGAEVGRYQGQVIATGPASAFVAVDGVRVLQALGGVVGASGAIFGVMMAAAMTAPNLRILLLLPPVPMKLKTFVAVYALIEVIMAWTSAASHAGSRIAHLAHLGGLAGAFLYMRHLGHGSPWSFCRNQIEAWRARRTRRRFQQTGGGQPPESGPSASDVDRILDKIGREGIQSLTEAERQTLQEAGRRFRETTGR